MMELKREITVFLFGLLACAASASAQVPQGVPSGKNVWKRVIGSDHLFSERGKKIIEIWDVWIHNSETGCYSKSIPNSREYCQTTIAYIQTIAGDTLRGVSKPDNWMNDCDAFQEVRQLVVIEDSIFRYKFTGLPYTGEGYSLISYEICKRH